MTESFVMSSVNSAVNSASNSAAPAAGTGSELPFTRGDQSITLSSAAIRRGGEESTA